MPIFEGDITNDDFLRQQLEFNKKVERLKNIRKEQQREEDINWLEKSWNTKWEN